MLELKGWQCNWKKWYSLKPWFSKRVYDFPEEYCAWHEYYFGLGSFLQFRAWGKPWPTHLIRSKEWSEKLKQELLIDLETQKYLARK